MYIGETGSVNDGGNNVKWSRELAKKLDEADGISDGKISASVWNAFLETNKSKGNKIKYSIDLKRAIVSFDYYLKKKDIDVNGLDWNNWKHMLNVYLDSINKPNLKIEEDAPVQGSQQGTESKQVDQSQITSDQSQTKGLANEGDTNTAVEINNNSPEGEITDGIAGYPSQADLKSAVDNFIFTHNSVTIPTETNLTEAGFEKGVSESGKTTFNKEKETITISDNPKLLTYEKEGILIIQEYDEIGLPKPMKVAIKGNNGSFATGVCRKATDGNIEVELKKQHVAPQTSAEFLLEAVDGYSNIINTLKNTRWRISRDFNSLEDILKDLNSENNTVEKFSRDNNYKMKISLSNDNKFDITYYQKNIDDRYVGVGKIEIEKYDDAASLRGYNFKLKYSDSNGGSYGVENGIKWDDFN